MSAADKAALQVRWIGLMMVLGTIGFIMLVYLIMEGVDEPGPPEERTKVIIESCRNVGGTVKFDQADRYVGCDVPPPTTKVKRFDDGGRLIEKGRE